MKTIRRAYYYMVALVSLEVVTWAVIGLARSALDTSTVGGSSQRLAGALAMILVGLPVFFVHWRLAQRDAAQDPEERFSAVRAVFLYAAMVSLFGPALQNLMAIVNRLFAEIFNLSQRYVFVGGSQELSDNLVAIVVNLVLAYYFWGVLQADWLAGPQGDGFAVTRRVSRYLWSLYGLGFAFAGIQQLLSFVFGVGIMASEGTMRELVNGLTFSIVGLPVWVYSWQQIQNSLTQEGERSSMLRTIFLYLVTFVSCVTVLISGGTALSEILRTILVSTEYISTLISRMGESLPVAIPAAALWGYYSRVLTRERNAVSDLPRRSGMRRLYFYVLGFLGLWAVFVGVELLLIFVVDMVFDTAFKWVSFNQRELADALAVILVGAPVWLLNWLPMSAEAAAKDEEGDHARRSVNRKGYLYLSLFIGVMGVMFSAGAILYQIFDAVLGRPPSDFVLTLVHTLVTLGLFVVVTLYHWRVQNQDSRMSSASLEAQHAAFPVVVIDPGDGEFAGLVAAAINKAAPKIPVTVYTAGEKIDKSLASASAIALPAHLLSSAPDALARWLGKYTGKRVVVPAQTDEWTWIGLDEDKLEKLAKQAAAALRQLAEGQTAATKTRSAWTVFGYIFGGVVGMYLLCMLVIILGNGID